MKRALRSIVLPSVFAAAGMFAFAPSAKAGAFIGFHGPHVSVSIGVGPGPFYPGYAVPAPGAVIYRPYYGYGFWAPAGFGYAAPYWVPVNRYHSSWVVAPYGRFFHGYRRPFVGHGHAHFRGNFHRRW